MQPSTGSIDYSTRPLSEFLNFISYVIVRVYKMHTCCILLLMNLLTDQPLILEAMKDNLYTQAFVGSIEIYHMDGVHDVCSCYAMPWLLFSCVP